MITPAEQLLPILFLVFVAFGFGVWTAVQIIQAPRVRIWQGGKLVRRPARFVPRPLQRPQMKSDRTLPGF